MNILIRNIEVYCFITKALQEKDKEIKDLKTENKKIKSRLEAIEKFISEQQK